MWQIWLLQRSYCWQLPTKPIRVRSMFRALLSILTFAAFLWTGGLVAFVHNIPVASHAPNTKTDAIVVLTGGDLRVAYGFRKLEEGAAGTLFISGVGEGVKRKELLAAFASPALRRALAAEPERLALDYAASDTQSNAIETAKFIHERGYKSIRLVTAGYHMPRSLLECQLLMPQVAIVADPVSPEAFRRDRWWQHETTRRIILSEFHKFWLVRVRAWSGQEQ